MRKLILLLVLSFLIIGSAASENSYLEMQLIIHDHNEESAISAEVLFREQEIVILSGLFPSYAFSVTANGQDILASIDNSDFLGPFFMPAFGNALSGIVRVLNPETVYGVFTGDLFDEANILVRGSCSWEDIITVPAKLSGIKEDNTPINTDIFLSYISKFINLSNYSKMNIQYSLYDNGKYLTLTGLEEGKTVFTVSFDFTDSSSLRTVAGYNENGSNYYWISNVTVNSAYEMNISSYMVTDPQRKGFRSAKNNIPVLMENWKATLSDNRKEIVFTCELLPSNDNSPVDISGILKLDEIQLLQVKANFRDTPDRFIVLNIKLNSGTVTTEGLKTIRFEDEMEISNQQNLFKEITINMLPFLNKLCQVLPDAYLEYINMLNLAN